MSFCPLSDRFCTGSTCPHGIMPPFECRCSRGPWWHTNYNCSCDTPPAAVKANLLKAESQSKFASIMNIPLPSPGADVVVNYLGPAAAITRSADTTLAPGVMQLSCLPGTGTMTVDFASFGQPNVGSHRSPSSGSSSGRSINCAAFKRSGCDAGPAVLARVKSLCDGKQSCRLNTTDRIFTMLPPTTPGCSTGTPLQLAVRATGCAQGTGGGERAWVREALAGFLLTRGDHWWMGFGWIATNNPIWFPEWDVEYGVPLGPMIIEGSVATRKWSNISVSLDMETMQADFIPT